MTLWPPKSRLVPATITNCCRDAKPDNLLGERGDLGAGRDTDMVLVCLPKDCLLTAMEKNY